MPLKRGLAGAMTMAIPCAHGGIDELSGGTGWAPFSLLWVLCLRCSSPLLAGPVQHYEGECERAPSGFKGLSPFSCSSL